MYSRYFERISTQKKAKKDWIEKLIEKKHQKFPKPV
jgi:hypothetical protein